MNARRAAEASKRDLGATRADAGRSPPGSRRSRSVGRPSPAEPAARRGRPLGTSRREGVLGRDAPHVGHHGRTALIDGCVSEDAEPRASAKRTAPGWPWAGV
jgi:hypothetical protein